MTYEEWKAATRVSIFGAAVAQMSIEYWDNGRNEWPSGDAMEGIASRAAIVTDNWEATTAP